YESTDEDIVFTSIDEELVKKILLKHDFSENRIDSGLEKLRKLEADKKQRGLSDFF
ncbi:MAG: flap structure-specific endonuclease, partial [Nanoarchaeota archaeon]|nr:flap structure-specific endonuclease [Nanoarchaeota archaeon]